MYGSKYGNQNSNCSAITIVKNSSGSKTILYNLLNDPKYYKYYRYSEDSKINGLSREEAAILRYSILNEPYSDTIVRTYEPDLWSDLPIIDTEIVYSSNTQYFEYYTLNQVFELMQKNYLLHKYYTQVLLNKKDVPLPIAMYKGSVLYSETQFCIHFIGHTNTAKCDAMRILTNEQ